MRILLLTQYYPPEVGAPQARLAEMVQRLRRMGHETTVLTAFPSYPTGRTFGQYRRKIRMRETIDGVDVIRTWAFPSNSSHFLPRLLSYFSFALSSLLLGAWSVGRRDLVLIESPPLFLAPSGLLISFATRARPVLMVADIWPDILIQLGRAKEGLGVKLMYWLERFCYNRAAAVTLTTPGMCQQIRDRFPHLRNVEVLSNGVDTSAFHPDLRTAEVREELGAGPDDLLVGYGGLHGLAQGLEIVIEAAIRLKERPDIKFVMVGDGPTKEGLKRVAEAAHLSNLVLIDQRPKASMPAIVASLDISLMPLSVRIPGAMPSKVFEALASGAVPIVANGTDADTLVTEHDAGLGYEPGDASDLVARILEIADDGPKMRRMRENGISLAQRFDRNLLAERTAALLAAVAENRRLPEYSW